MPLFRMSNAHVDNIEPNNIRCEYHVKAIELP